jgi:anti-sigma-K factor RskA
MSGAGMGGTGPTDPFEEQEIAAAEYVMGMLPPDQARALEARALTDMEVAASIAAWEKRLAPLADLVPPTPPPAVLWQRLALATGISSVIQAPPPARTDRVSAWRRTEVWQAMTMGSLAIAASLAMLLYNKPVAPAAPLIAALSPYGAPGATFLVRVGADGAATIIAVGAASVPAGKSLELWALKAGATTPVSLGLLPESGRIRLMLPIQAGATQGGTQLLVSQEQEGGSPTKLPTGPVVYAGQLTGI